MHAGVFELCCRSLLLLVFERSVLCLSSQLHHSFRSACLSLAAAVDMYTQFLGTSASIDALFMRLHSTILREIGLGKELLGLQGALDLLMAASTTGDSYAGGEATSASAFGGSELAYN